MRLRYQRRRDQLVATLAERVPGVRVTGMAAGLQAVIELPHGTERAVVAAAADQGLAVSGLAEYRYEVPESELAVTRDGRAGRRLCGPVRQCMGWALSTPCAGVWHRWAEFSVRIPQE